MGLILMRMFIVATVAALAGCLVPPTNPSDINAYNNQIVQLLTPFITPLVTLLGVICLWVKSNWDKRDLAAHTEAAKAELAAKTEQEATRLADLSKERNERVLTEMKQTKEINVTALETANSHNEKIAALTQQVADSTKRVAGRASDAASTAAPTVQKVEIVSGPGSDIEHPLSVHDVRKGPSNDE